MLIPCLETYKRMVGAHAGIWPELVNDGSKIELAVKISSDVVKSVFKGAPVTLFIAVVRVSNESVRVVGLRIEDDKSNPIFVHQPQGNLTEQQLFQTLLKNTPVWITFFDELVRPVVSGKVFWNEDEAKLAIAELQRTAPHYCGNFLPTLEKALDATANNFSKWHQNEGQIEALAWKSFALRFENLQTVNVSSLEAGEFSIDDHDEGAALEKSLYLMLEANFPGSVFLNPQIDDGSVRREFSDVLIVADKRLFVVQSKVMAVLEQNPDQSTERRVANVFSNFQKAVKQLNGCARMLKLRRTIYSKEGNPISLNLDLIKEIHGIALLSTTNLPLPWQAIATKLVSAGKKASAKFHLLDFIEFQQHIAFGKTLNGLGMILNRRFEVVEGSGNANLKTRFVSESDADQLLN
jgi:hypothetical protein